MRLQQAGVPVRPVAGARTYHLTHRTGWRDPLADTEWQETFYARHPHPAVELMPVFWRSISDLEVPGDRRIMSLPELSAAAGCRNASDRNAFLSHWSAQPITGARRRRLAQVVTPMIYQLVLPRSMEDVEEFCVLEWHAEEGDAIASDGLLVQLETQKAILQVRAFLRAVVTSADWCQIGDWRRLGERSPLSDVPTSSCPKTYRRTLRNSILPSTWADRGRTRGSPHSSGTAMTRRVRIEPWRLRSPSAIM